MPLNHVQNQEKQRAQRRGDIPPDDPAPEPQTSGFTTTFAPVPEQPTQSAEAQERPAAMPAFPQSAQPLAFQQAPSSPAGEPTANIKVLHQTGPYAPGSVVPASCFSDIGRLLGLHAIEYTHETANAIGPDASMAAAMAGARPVAPSAQGIPHAPWVQASVRDILGPAVARGYVPPQQPGYSNISTEWGNTMVVADRQ